MTEHHKHHRGDDELSICDPLATVCADNAASGTAVPPTKPEWEADEAGMVRAVAADNDSEGSYSCGRRMRRARLAKQWSQQQLAHRMRQVGAEHRGAATLHSLLIMISKWENDRKCPNQYSLHLIAAALEIDVVSLGLPVDQDFVF